MPLWSSSMLLKCYSESCSCTISSFPKHLSDSVHFFLLSFCHMVEKFRVGEKKGRSGDCNHNFFFLFCLKLYEKVKEQKIQHEPVYTSNNHIKFWTYHINLLGKCNLLFYLCDNFVILSIRSQTSKLVLECKDQWNLPQCKIWQLWLQKHNRLKK